jgi:hypothetical protein
VIEKNRKKIRINETISKLLRIITHNPIKRMKKTLTILAIATVFIASLSSCAERKTFQVGQNDYIEALPYGPADADDVRMDTVVYQTSTGNIVWSIIFSESVVIPVWLIGWDLYEPVRLKTTAEYNNVKIGNKR